MAKRIKAMLVDDIDGARNAPGAFEYFVKGQLEGSREKIAGMIFVCPCGCGRTCAIDFKPAESPSWTWDGNREAPTLAPSIHRWEGDGKGGRKSHWHGFLRAGVWEKC